MKITLTAKHLKENPLLSDCAVGDVLSVEHKKEKKKGGVSTLDEDDSTDPDKPRPPKPPNEG